MMPKARFKSLVSNSIQNAAFVYLSDRKSEQSKICHIQYKKFEMQPYLKANKISTEDARFHFKTRSSMINVRGNFKYQFNSESLFCRACMRIDDIESQVHIYSCPSLSSSEIISNDDEQEYQDLFCDDLEKQLRVSAVLKKRRQRLEQIISEREISAQNSK